MRISLIANFLCYLAVAAPDPKAAKPEGPETATQAIQEIFIPLAAVAALDPRLVKEWGTVQLDMGDKGQLFGKVQTVLQGKCDPGPDNCFAEIFLSGNIKVDIHDKELVVSCGDRQIFNHVTTKGALRKLSNGGGCVGSLCGVASFSGNNCAFQTGVFGGFSRCNTPSAIINNTFDPVLSGFRPTNLGLLPGGVNFAQQNGWF